MKDDRRFRRKSDIKILHTAKAIIQCELALNHQVDNLLGLIGLTREEVIKGVDKNE